MESLEQPELVENISSYTMKVCSTLIMMAYVNGIDPDDLVEFFATQVQAMLNTPPNYKMYGNTPPVWVMRGFFPLTTLFFKLVVARNEKGTWAKASIPMIRIGKNRSWDKVVKLDGNQLNKTIVDKMENTFFGATHQIKPLVEDRVRKMPRCMSPKGVKIFNCELPRTRKKVKSKRSDSKQILDKGEL